jgi:hypothetical protein
MRTRILYGLGILLAAGAIAGCADEQVSAPNPVPSFGATNGNGPPEPCDPKKENCEGTVRFTGGGKQIVEGSGFKITDGFTLHCDILLSNNLNIQFESVGHWHLNKPITNAECSDDPTVSPNPPPAPLDTIEGDGIGELDGVDGYRVHFYLQDSGEGGGKNDKVQFQLFDPGGALVFDTGRLVITGGNIQAHLDQPHK